MTDFFNHNDLRGNIFNISPGDFEAIAIAMFQNQYRYSKVYREYCDAIRIQPAKITDIKKIPFLPIQFFKSRQVTNTSFTPAKVFESSGTTGSVNSKHFVKDIAIYRESFSKAFNIFYGEIKGKCVIGLLPSYLEREHSSLVFMVNELISRSENPRSGFYLYDLKKLYQTLAENEAKKQQTIVIGVTYALLDFAEKFSIPLNHTIIMETGGMKGRRKELTRQEVHMLLSARFGHPNIHSEYGMTELLSQAYSNGNGIFTCPPWMKILLRAEDDPFEVSTCVDKNANSKSGVINIIDLANLYSCAFIATDDIGKLYPDGKFEVLGRLDQADTRGCGLMIM